jgi:hypothetical protein
MNLRAAPARNCRNSNANLKLPSRQSIAIVRQMDLEKLQNEIRPHANFETKALSLVDRESPLNHNGINKEPRRKDLRRFVASIIAQVSRQSLAHVEVGET